jgi:hypothetical protein
MSRLDVAELQLDGNEIVGLLSDPLLNIVCPMKFTTRSYERDLENQCNRGLFMPIDANLATGNCHTKNLLKQSWISYNLPNLKNARSKWTSHWMPVLPEINWLSSSDFVDQMVSNGNSIKLVEQFSLYFFVCEIAPMHAAVVFFRTIASQWKNNLEFVGTTWNDRHNLMLWNVIRQMRRDNLTSIIFFMFPFEE